MYYKLPIKDRMDLMKSYKKTNPNMSYHDMVNDYNESYQKYGNGGIREPITTNDPNDPRIAAYNDSLSTYDWAKNRYNKVVKTGKSFKGSNVDVNNVKLLSKKQAVDDNYNHYLDFGLNLSKKDISDEMKRSDAVNKGTKRINEAVSYYRFPLSDTKDSNYKLAQYKKPVQPYLYQQPEPKIEPKVESKVEPKKELPKQAIPIFNSDTLTRHWNFNGPNPTLGYYDKTNKLIKEESYDNSGPNKKLIETNIQKYGNGGKTPIENTNVAHSYFPDPDKVNMDPRRIPQSGMVVDKRTNQAYYFGNNGETGSFPVLTAKNPEANKNTYSLNQLSNNSKLRSTPKGYYTVEKESKYKSKDDMQHYKGLMRSLNPISAYGESKPQASDLAFHLTFTDPSNPKVFSNREHLYNQVPEKRFASYGCVNCQEPSYRTFNNAVPESDTLMVLDSKDPRDLRLLKQAQSRIKTKIKD